jgi:hydrogenase maturation protease
VSKRLSNNDSNNGAPLSNARRSVLVIGYGNPGREDDGLGPAFVHALPINDYELTLSDPYQLTVEDALSFKDDMLVVFVDAAKHLSEPFEFLEVQPSAAHELGSHTLSPEALLQLSDTVFGVRPQAFIMAIRGYQFDNFDEQLSEPATNNLRQAIEFFNQWLTENAARKEPVQPASEAHHA